MAFADRGYTDADPALAAAEQGVLLEVVKLPPATQGFVLLRCAAWSSGAWCG